MLSELEREFFSFEFGEAKIAMRFSLADFLALEKLGINYMEVFGEKLAAWKIKAFFRIGLCEDFPENTVAGMLDTLGYEKVWELCRAAMELALPKADPWEIPDFSEKRTGEFSFYRLRTLVCDVMGKSEDFFRDSTLSELLKRWEDYAVAMGYKKPRERVQKYDTEGL